MPSKPALLINKKLTLDSIPKTLPHLCVIGLKGNDYHCGMATKQKEANIDKVKKLFKFETGCTDKQIIAHGTIEKSGTGVLVRIKEGDILALEKDVVRFKSCFGDGFLAKPTIKPAVEKATGKRENVVELLDSLKESYIGVSAHFQNLKKLIPEARMMAEIKVENMPQGAERSALQAALDNLTAAPEILSDRSKELKDALSALAIKMEGLNDADEKKGKLDGELAAIRNVMTSGSMHEFISMFSKNTVPEFFDEPVQALSKIKNFDTRK